MSQPAPATLPVTRLPGSLTLVLPAFNEEANIEAVVQDSLTTLPTFVDTYEIIVVDDGSRDRTGEIVARLAAGNDRVQLVSHGRNRGYGAALRSGFGASTGDFVMFMDADRQFNIRDLRLLVPFAGEYDIVAGFRMERSDPLHRRVLAEMFNVSVRVLFGVHLRDIDCAFKLFRGDLLRGLPLTAPGALINTEIQAKARRQGARLQQVGVHHYPRVAGEATGGSPRVILRAVGETLALWWRMRRYRPVRLHPNAERPSPQPPPRHATPKGHPAPGTRYPAQGAGRGGGRERDVSMEMRDDPGLDLDTITACLDVAYDLRVSSITFLPLGYDLNAAVYKVITGDGTAYFLKVRFGPVDEIGLLVPWALAERGIRNVLAPLQTRSGALWCSCDDCSLVLYPFIAGQNAMDAGMNDDQWREFGLTLRAVHDIEVAEEFSDRLPVETFALPSAALVRRILDLTENTKFENPVAARFAAFWQDQAARIQQMLARAEELGRQLQSKSFDHVLCHADIHAANILVHEDGRISLIDWDGPMIAPRERDLLFVVGSIIARVVELREEELFFAGYGLVEIDPEALIYYRYERIVQDLGEIGRSVLLESNRSDQMRDEESRLARSFFAPGGDVDHAELVSLPNR